MSALFKSLPSAPNPDDLQNQPGLTATVPPAPDTDSRQNEPSLANGVNSPDNPLQAWAQHAPEAGDETGDDDPSFRSYIFYDQLKQAAALRLGRPAPDGDADLSAVPAPVTRLQTGFGQNGLTLQNFFPQPPYSPTARPSAADLTTFPNPDSGVPPTNPPNDSNRVLAPFEMSPGSPPGNAPGPSAPIQLAQNSAVPTVPPTALYGPPLPVQLPNGTIVLDPNTGAALMAPFDDLSPVADEGRRAGRTAWTLSKAGTTRVAGLGYLASELFRNLAHGGTFDYQRTGHGPVLGLFLGFNYISDFAPVSNFNVGLFCQQAGLTLDETLRIAGRYALNFAQNADPASPYGLEEKNERLITEGYNIGASGVFGPTAATIRKQKAMKWTF